jgi:hypothetical protein
MIPAPSMDDKSLSEHLRADREWCRYLHVKRECKLIFEGGPYATTPMSVGFAFPSAPLGGVGAMSFVRGDTAVKVAVLAVITLSVLIGVATPAGADPFNAKVFFEQQQRWGGGGGGGGGGM